MGKFSQVFKKQQILKNTQGKKRQRIDDLPLPEGELIDDVAQALSENLKQGDFSGKSAKIEGILELVAVGVFSAKANKDLPEVVRPFVSDIANFQASKRFNIPYLKRILDRLAIQGLIRIVKNNEDRENITLVDAGKRRILKYALRQINITPQEKWDGIWRLVIYDLPSEMRYMRNILRNQLKTWGFVPLQESIFINPYPCGLEVDCLREYLNLGKKVRVIEAVKVENDQNLKEKYGLV